jgi:hypothetical protein
MLLHVFCSLTLQARHTRHAAVQAPLQFMENVSQVTSKTIIHSVTMALHSGKVLMMSCISTVEHKTALAVTNG